MPQQGRPAGRVLIVSCIILGLIASFATRHWAAERRGERHLAATTPLSRMNSYALALLLGGLRGPLVMFLWPSSEGQKSEKNLEDFDTKVEWIRLLQAEFDTVHIFQIWNKAYNISVLMANLPNKYATILDALDYAMEVDAERPANINILTAIAGLYGDKLGGSAEKDYYKQRIREETQARRPMMRVTFPEDRQDEFTELARKAGMLVTTLRFTPAEDGTKLAVTLPKRYADQIQPQFTGDAITWQQRQPAPADRRTGGFRRVQLDPVLDEHGNILPALLRPRPGRGAVGSNDGSELQYLKPFQPFPHGLSAHALAYNYHKRAQVLMRENNQHHAQLSDLVIDSRPAIKLRDWAEDAWERGMIAELEAFGRPIPTEPEQDDLRVRLARAIQDLPLDAEPDNAAALDQAIFEFERSAQVARASLDEYQAHLDEYTTNFSTYQSHMDLLEAQIALTSGDAAYLRLVRGDPGEDANRDAIASRAAENYRAARQRLQLHLIRYYLERDHVEMLPEGVTQANAAEKLTHEQVTEFIERVRDDVNRKGEMAQHVAEFYEYFTYIRRAETRLRNLPPVDGPAPATTPTTTTAAAAR